ncbi:MAG TPA: hypothetical protein VFW25_01095 [Silvibacterium sp.]|nr:hypothetical protein [Silvibacterium sp.]
MILPILSIAAVAVPAAYAIYWRRAVAKRRSADWNSIVARFRAHSEFGFADITERYLYSPGIQATPQDIWPRIQGATGLWAMFVNAGVLMELADYASAHGGEAVPEMLLEELRSDALQLRLAVLIAIARYGFSRSGVSASVNAHRAACAYSAMLAHMTTLFQEHSALFFPRFLEAM